MLTSVSLTLVLCGCGYTLVKKSELHPVSRRLPADSTTIVSLQQQISALQKQCKKEDSLRTATQTSKDSTPPSAASDSVLRAREEEIASLREQLTRLTEELGRIKRRLANPRS